MAKKGKKSKQRKKRTKPSTERKSEEQKSERERADEAIDEAPNKKVFRQATPPPILISNEASAPRGACATRYG